MATTTLATTLNSPISGLWPATMDRILVIEEDIALQKALQRLFSSEGYEIDIAPDGITGLKMIRQRRPSALILDLRHPGSSGCDLCCEIVSLAPGLPFVILSASPDVANKVLFLELGADDYVTIPFSPRELMARMRALLRRAAKPRPETFYVFDDIKVDFSRMYVTRGGEKVPLTTMEFKVLEFMTTNAQRVISRDELLHKVWGYQYHCDTRTVDNHILKLRQKLEGDPSDPAHFLTLHGRGYKFVP